MRRTLGLLLVVITVVSGCATSGAPPVEQPAAVRTDLDPLTRRFPGLATPAAAVWKGGELGDADRAPGPSTYYLKAVVTVDPATTARLLQTKPKQTEAPAVPGDLAGSLPSGPWYAGKALDDALTAGTSEPTDVDAYLNPEANVVVLLAQGGN